MPGRIPTARPTISSCEGQAERGQLAERTCDTGAAAPNDKVICLTSLTGITTAADPSASALAASKGWYLGLNAHEQVVTSAITVFGNVTFSTHTRQYRSWVRARRTSVPHVSTTSVTSRRREAWHQQSIGHRVRRRTPASPVAGKVTLDDGTTYPFIIGADPASSLEGSLPTAPSTGTQPKSLTYWYIEK